MQRRSFLQMAGIAGALAATGTGAASDGGTEAARVETEGDDSPIVDAEFEVTDVSCGMGESRSSLSVDRETAEATIDGVVPGRNGCYRAELAGVEYDSETDRAIVEIEPYEADDAEVCLECLVDIEYQVHLRFEAESPEIRVCQPPGL